MLAIEGVNIGNIKNSRLKKGFFRREFFIGKRKVLLECAC